MKSFVRRQPSDWSKTGNEVVDAIRKVRFQLKDTADLYATSIDTAIKDAARMYEMDSRMEVTIHYPKNGVEQIDADQQKRIEVLWKEFQAFVREHNLRTDYVKPKKEEDGKEDVLKSIPASSDARSLPNFYYTDSNGQRRLVNEQQLKTLVTQRIILPNTLLETEGGRKGLAGQIPGLFVVSSPQSIQSQTTSPQQNFEVSDYLRIIFVGSFLDPTNKAKVENMTPKQKAELFRWRLIVGGVCLCLLICFMAFFT